MSIRGDGKQMIALTDIWADEGTLIRAGTALPAKHPAVRRCKDFFAEASLVPSLEPEALHELQRGLWAKSLAGDAE